jgi:hypothetical protein
MVDSLRCHPICCPFEKILIMAIYSRLVPAISEYFDKLVVMMNLCSECHDEFVIRKA